MFTQAIALNVTGGGVCYCNPQAMAHLSIRKDTNCTAHHCAAPVAPQTGRSFPCPVILK